MDFNKILENLANFGTTWGLKVVGTLVAFFVAWIVAGRIKARMVAGFERRKFDKTLGAFFANMVRYGILIGALLGCLGVFGIQTASFAAVIAAAGLAIGLAFQGTLSNFAAGVMLLVFRPFKVGDLVNVSGMLGIVSEIELFTTQLDTLDKRAIIIPNSKIFGDVIENITHHPIRRVDVPVGVEYGADIDQTRAVLDKAAQSVEGVLDDPPYQIFLKELGASSVDWQIRVWCKTEAYWDVYQATIRAAKMHLDEAGLGIPFPQVDVHFDSPEAAAKAIGR